MSRTARRTGDVVVVVIVLAAAAEFSREIHHYCPTVEGGGCIPVGGALFFASLLEVAVCWAGYRIWSTVRRRHPGRPAEPPRMS